MSGWVAQAVACADFQSYSPGEYCPLVLQEAEHPIWIGGSCLIVVLGVEAKECFAFLVVDLGHGGSLPEDWSNDGR